MSLIKKVVELIRDHEFYQRQDEDTANRIITLVQDAKNSDSWCEK